MILATDNISLATEKMTLTTEGMTLTIEKMTVATAKMTLATETHREYHCWERCSSFGVDHGKELRQMSLPSSGKHQSERRKESPGPGCSKSGSLYPVDKSLSESFNLCKDFSISSRTSEYAHSNHS